MRNKLIISAAILAALGSAAANATLEPRLSGMAYYDTDTGLTWAAHTLTLGMDFFEYVDFLSTFVLGGTGDWEIPRGIELINLVANYSITDPSGFFTTPLPPLDNGIAWFNYIWVKDPLPAGLNAYSPGLNDFYPFPDPDLKYTIWPVHHGDGPLVAVPEPSTYALLLAGLGLVGFSLRRKVN